MNSVRREAVTPSHVVVTTTTVDASPRSHYIARVLELLLILSAMLSALTGAITSARAPEVRLHRSVAVVRAAVRPAMVAVGATRRPAFQRPRLARLSMPPVRVIPEALPADPIFAGRRRE